MLRRRCRTKLPNERLLAFFWTVDWPAPFDPTAALPLTAAGQHALHLAAAHLSACSMRPTPVRLSIRQVQMHRQCTPIRDTWSCTGTKLEQQAHGRSGLVKFAQQPLLGQPPLGRQRGLAAGAGGRDGLPPLVVVDVARRKNARHAGVDALVDLHACDHNFDISSADVALVWQCMCSSNGNACGAYMAVCGVAGSYSKADNAYSQVFALPACTRWCLHATVLRARRCGLPHNCMLCLNRCCHAKCTACRKAWEPGIYHEIVSVIQLKLSFEDAAVGLMPNAIEQPLHS